MHEESIFHKALEIESADERESYLDQTCAGDTELRQRVDALLKAHDDPGTYLKKPDLDHEAATLLPSPVSERPVTERPGSSIGPYKLLQQIDSSGPGVERMAFSQKTGLFAIRFRNRLVEVWNLANGEQLFQWQLSTPAAPEIDSVLEFTADGKHLAALIGTGQFQLLQLDSINPELKKIGLGWQ